MPLPSSHIEIAVHYAGINRADLLQKQGLYPPPAGVTDTLGLECSGIITAIGEHVENFEIGDEVCALLPGGGYGDKVSCPAHHCIPLPSNLTLEEGGGIMEAYITAFQSLSYIGKLKDGEKVLIHAGSSGVGAAAIQLAKAIGAYVITTASSNKHEFCLDLEADECIDYKSEDFGDYIARNHPQRVNMILDLVGGNTLAGNLRSLAMEGRMVMLGFLDGVKASGVNIAPIVGKRLTIQGSTLRSRPDQYKAELVRLFSEKYIEKDSFPFDPCIDRIFPLSEVDDAHDYMQEGLHKGKIVLEVSNQK